MPTNEEDLDAEDTAPASVPPDERDESTPEDEQDDSKKKSGPDWEKRFNDSQTFITKLTGENRDMRDRLARLEGRLEAAQPREKPEASEPGEWVFLDDKGYDEEVMTDPAKGDRQLAAAMRSELNRRLAALEQGVVAALQTRDQHYGSVLRKADPANREALVLVDELREDPDYAGASEDELMRAAKTLLKRGAAKPGGRQTLTPRGGPAGGRGPVAGGGERSSALKQYESQFMRMLYPNDEEDGKGGK